MEDTSPSLSDYVDMGKRHRRAMLIIFLALLSIGLLFARFLPPTYVSSATILVEAQEIPSELVRSTVTSVAAQRIQAISQRVMTRRNLLRIMDATEIYADRRERETTEAVIKRMRESIELDMIEGTVAIGGGRSTMGTIAFNVAFSGSKPTIVQKVTNEITTLYLNENLQERTQAARETLGFLTQEADALTATKEDLGGKLAEFKTQHRNNLPELHSLNIQLLNAAEERLQLVNEAMQEAEAQILDIRNQLSITDRHGITVDSDTGIDPTLRLYQYRTELQVLQGTYGPEHPDIRRLQRTVASLEKDIGVEALGSPDTSVELLRLQEELSAAQNKYSEGHPDIIRLSKAVAALESKSPTSAQASNPEESAGDSTEETDRLRPTNPAYRNLQRNLRLVQNTYTMLGTRRERIAAKYDELEERLLVTPQIEREYEALVGAYETVTTQLGKVTLKQIAARLGQTIEEERKGERFTLIEPATLPEEPIKPNRPLIVVLSVILSLGAAVAYVVAVEGLDSSVRGTKSVLRILNVAPMAVIPYQELDIPVSEKRRKKLAIKIGIVMAIVVIAGLLVLLHLFVSPLDVLWFRVLRKASVLLGITLL